MAKPNATPMRVIEETPGYWRAVFDYPPFNVVDGDVFQALQDLLVRMETTETLRVVVFESALPDFYLSHFDLTGKLGNVMTRYRPHGLTHSDGHVRAPNEGAGRQPRKNPGLRARREQRVRPCLRHALRLAREHETRSPRTRGRAASRRRRHRAPSPSGGTRAGARNRSERQRL